MPKPRETLITGRSETLLRTCLGVALERFNENAQQCRAALADPAEVEKMNKPGAFVTPMGYQRLAEQFEQQAADTLKLLALIDGPDDFEGEVELVVRLVEPV